jgi:hypothetical protein
MEDKKTIKKYSIHQKLAIARKELSLMDVKKTGKNAHFGFSYYELSDILPPIIKIEESLNMISVFETFDTENVLDLSTNKIVAKKNGFSKLDIICTETKDFITFNIPQVLDKKTLVKGNAYQELGSANTYLKKLAYFNAYNIIEVDMIDASDNKTKPPTKPEATPPTTPMSADQIAKMMAALENIQEDNIVLEDIIARFLKDNKLSDINQITRQLSSPLLKLVKESTLD